MGSTTTAAREIIRFQPGQPETVVLKYANGREVQGAGGPQFMFTTVDNRILFLDPDIAYNVEKCATAAGQGEPIVITKSKGPRNTVNWDVRPAIAQSQAAGAPAIAPARFVSSAGTTSAPTSLEQTLAASIAQAQAKKAAAQEAPAAPVAAAQDGARALAEYLGRVFFECGKQALFAAAALEQVAKDAGFDGFRFSADAVERIAVHLSIGAQERSSR